MDPQTSMPLEDAPAGARCAVHVEAPATVVCARCGNYCCYDCGVQFDSRYLCKSCFARERVAFDYGEATKGQRVTNFLIDYMIISVFLYFVVVAVLGIMANGLALFFLRALIMIGYYMLTEGVSGMSVGKLVTRTRVVTESGAKPEPAQILKRTLIRFVPFDGFTFLGDRGWHDAWSETRVVRTTPPDWMK